MTTEADKLMDLFGTLVTKWIDDTHRNAEALSLHDEKRFVSDQMRVRRDEVQKAARQAATQAARVKQAAALHDVTAGWYRFSGDVARYAMFLGALGTVLAALVAMGRMARTPAIVAGTSVASVTLLFAVGHAHHTAGRRDARWSRFRW